MKRKIHLELAEKRETVAAKSAACKGVLGKSCTGGEKKGNTNRSRTAGIDRLNLERKETAADNQTGGGG